MCTQLTRGDNVHTAYSRSIEYLPAMTGLWFVVVASVSQHFHCCRCSWTLHWMRWWNLGAKGWPQLESESICLAHQHPKGKSAERCRGEKRERVRLRKKGRRGEKKKKKKKRERRRRKGKVITNVWYAKAFQSLGQINFSFHLSSSLHLSRRRGGEHTSLSGCQRPNIAGLDFLLPHSSFLLDMRHGGGRHLYLLLHKLGWFTGRWLTLESILNLVDALKDFSKWEDELVACSLVVRVADEVVG